MSSAYDRLSLDGRRIIVTGASTGMGRTTARLLAARGASVMLADVNVPDGQSLLEEIRGAGGNAAFEKVDVSSEPDVAAMVEATVSTFGGLDGAFNNAGIARMENLHETSADDWDRIIGINLSGIFYCMKHEISYLLKHGGGSIVNTASLAGVKSVPGMAAYVASKHGVVGLTRAASQDYAKAGIRVNAILPALIRTPMFDATGDIARKLEEGQPIGRAGDPEDIAEQAAWLLSDASSYSTGSMYAVDGGSNSI
jgi:2,5-dichloro-2,5-cyclohexadiene-1,4-diol dehydrogenase 1